MPRIVFDPGAKLGRIVEALRNPRKALKQIGMIMLSESQAAFKNQEWDGYPWPPRSTPNVFGIIADFTAGRSVPLRRFDARPALQDTGRLVGSLASTLVGDNAVEVGTTVPYAAVHQTGGETSSEPITAKVQAALGSWLKGQSADIKQKLDWMLKPTFLGKTLTQEVPARPFVGITKDTRDAIRYIVGVDVMEVQ